MPTMPEAWVDNCLLVELDADEVRADLREARLDLLPDWLGTGALVGAARRHAAGLRLLLSLLADAFEILAAGLEALNALPELGGSLNGEINIFCEDVVLVLDLFFRVLTAPFKPFHDLFPLCFLGVI